MSMISLGLALKVAAMFSRRKLRLHGSVGFPNSHGFKWEEQRLESRQPVSGAWLGRGPALCGPVETDIKPVSTGLCMLLQRAPERERAGWKEEE